MADGDGNRKQPIGMYERPADAAIGITRGCLYAILLWVIIAAVLVALGWWYGVIL